VDDSFTGEETSSTAIIIGNEILIKL